MNRKRAAGGGRKPKGQFSQLSSTLTIRIPDDMRKQLESEAAAKNESMSQRLMWHLRQSFNRELDNQRDPAIRGLLYMIANLAESLGKYGDRPPVEEDLFLSAHRAFSLLQEGDLPESDLPESHWRTDWRAFRAFKVAVGKLLAALEEPPIPAWFPLTEKQRKKTVENMVKDGDNPELAKAFFGLRFRSAEEMGEEEFSRLWHDVQRAGPPKEELRELHRMYPELERDFYTLPKAWKALQLKASKTARPKRTKADD